MSRLALLALIAALAASAPAQDAVPLVRKKSDRVKVSVKKKDSGKKTEGTAAKDEADPRTIIVGVVNGHRLTRAELNYETERRLKALGGRSLLADNEGTMYVLGKDLKPERADADAEMKQFMEDQAESSRLRAEGQALQDWVEARVLADEARRQGIAVDAKELEAELVAARKELGVTQKDFAAMLQRVGIDEAKFEAEVHDAVLAKRLVNKYIEANWTDADLKPIYERNPAAFNLPTRVRLAQYVVAALGIEKKDDLKRLKDRAERMKRRMEKETDLRKVMESETDLDNGFLGTADTGWNSLTLETLAPIVSQTAAKMSVGSVSAVLTDMDPYADDTIRSYQVIKLLERKDAGTPSFENARPQVQALLEVEAREELAARLISGRTHRILTNLRSVSPDLLPTADQLTKLAAAAPFPLKRKS